MQCGNNLKQWALALQNHHDVHRKLPFASAQLDYTSDVPTSMQKSNRNRQSWPPQLWPFIEEQQLYDWYNHKIGFYQSPNIVQSSLDSPCGKTDPIYNCPSDRSPAYYKGDAADTSWRVRGSYAVNWGPTPWQLPSGFSTPTAFAPFGFTDFASRSKPRRTRYKEFLDGTSKTLVFSEKIMHPDDLTTDIRGDMLNDDGCSMFMTIETPNTSVADKLRVGYTFCHVAPMLPCEDGTSSTGVYQSARSMHPGGVQSAMADGSVHFHTDEIALNLWQALSTMNGGESLP